MRDGPSHYSFRKWAACPCCGLDYPVNELRRDYTGRKRCPTDWDEKGFNEYKTAHTIRVEEIDEVDSMEDLL